MSEPKRTLRILGFVPASGWLSAWACEDDKGNAEVYTEPLVGWAIVEKQWSDGETDFSVEPVVLMDGTYLELACEIDYDDMWLGLCGPGEDPKCLLPEAARRIEHRRRAVAAPPPAQTVRPPSGGRR